MHGYTAQEDEGEADEEGGGRRRQWRKRSKKVEPTRVMPERQAKARAREVLRAAANAAHAGQWEITYNTAYLRRSCGLCPAGFVMLSWV